MNSDVISLIYNQCHPYLARGLIYSNKYYREIAEKHKFDMLKSWCCRNLSMKEIRIKYNQITLPQIIEASMYYYPIQESLCYFNRLELLYSACENNFSEEDLDIFIDYSSPLPLVGNFDDLVTCDIQALILYKFDRIQEFKLPTKGLSQVLHLIKCKKALSVEDIDPVNFTIIFNNNVLSLEVIVDLIFRMSTIDHVHVFEFTLGIIGAEILGPFIPYSIKSINNILGVEKIKQLISPYRPQAVVRSINFPEEERNAVIAEDKEYFIFSQYFDVNSRAYARKHIDISAIPINEKCLHALEVRDRLSFIQYRDMHYPLPPNYTSPFTPMLINNI